MEGEKAERRVEVRNRSAQGQEVSLAHIFPPMTDSTESAQVRPLRGKPTGAEQKKVYNVQPQLKHIQRHKWRVKRRKKRTCADRIYSIMDELEHENYPRTIPSLVHPMW